MPDRENFIKAIDICLGHGKCVDCAYHSGANYSDQNCRGRMLRDALDLLKKQDEIYKNLVISWLREIAINNVDSNREMTFLDAVEDIRDRASFGLKQYFTDKKEAGEAG